MKLVLLWFGLWKNSESYYVPMWVKQDPKTYWCVENVQGARLNIISPFCEAAVKKMLWPLAVLWGTLRTLTGKKTP